MITWKKVLLGMGLALILLLGVGPLVVPVPPLPDTVPAQNLADPDSRFAAVEGLLVHYKIQGSGSPVLVLLHGFGASTFSWREVMTPLSARGTVLAYDRPGFGLTERPVEWEGDNPYAPDSQIQLIFSLLRSLDMEGEVILVGNSAGGTIATAAALSQPDRVAGLILVDAAIYTGGGSPDWIRPLLRTPQMARIGPLIARLMARGAGSFLERAYHDPSLITEEVREGYRRPLRAQGWDKGLWEYTRASRILPLGPRLDQLDMPTLVITGDDDRIVPTEESLRLAREIPGAQLAVLEDCGHVPQEECPAQFLGAVEGFLAEMPTGSP